MTQLSVMELAKQGDPNAIAALINRSLTSKGIHASAELESPQCLKISLQASQVPSQKAIVTIIHRGMMVLQIEQLKSVKIFTYCSDNNYLAWRYEIILNNNFDESLPNPQIVKSTESDQARTTPDQSMNLVKNSSGVLLVQKSSQIQQNLQEYQDVIVRFTDEHMGNVRCLTTLTELIQVISKPSFLFTTVASNPNLRSLLDTIAESSKTDEHGDQVITNLSILQPGQQWQKAKIRLVSKIFLEPAEDEQPADDNHQGLTLDLTESQPEEVEPEEIKLEEVEPEEAELEEVILEEMEKKPVSYDDSPVLDNEVSQDSSENSNGSSEPERITTDSLFDEFDSFPSSTSPSSTSLIIDEPINAQVTDDVTSSEVTEIADWSKSPSLTASSLFDDFPDMENTDDVTVRLVDDETIPLDEDQDLFNNFGFGQRSPDVSSSSASSIKMSETEEDIEAIKSRISKQNLDKLLSLIEQEDKPNPESPSISNQVSNQNTSQLNAQLNADIGAKTMERILGETSVINQNGVDSADSNGNKSSTLITLEDFWAD
jgi:hypothetical protein